MQINKTLTSLDLYGNDLGPEGGKAVAKSLEVNLHFQCYRSNNEIDTGEQNPYIALLCMTFFAQVNTSITKLNLEDNELDAEAGKALGKALEVSPIFIVIALLYDIEYLIVLLPFSDQQIYHQSQS